METCRARGYREVCADLEKSLENWNERRAHQIRTTALYNGSCFPSLHWLAGWLAGAVVGFEPVSDIDSLPTGNFTGKFAIPDPKMPIQEQKTAAPQRFSDNSLSKRTGKILDEQGIVAREQGR